MKNGIVNDRENNDAVEEDVQDVWMCGEPVADVLSGGRAEIAGVALRGREPF